MLGLFAALLAIYGVLLTAFIIHVSSTDGTGGKDAHYTLILSVSLALAMFLVGYISARKLASVSIKILIALTLFFLLSTVIEVFDYFIGPSIESETIRSAVSMLLSLPIALILYFLIVKLLPSRSQKPGDK